MFQATPHRAHWQPASLGELWSGYYIESGDHLDVVDGNVRQNELDAIFSLAGAYISNSPRLRPKGEPPDFSGLGQIRVGYAYSLVAVDANGKEYGTPEYGICAYPRRYGETGHHTYIMNHHGIIYFADTGGVRVTSFPDTWEELRLWRRLN